MKKEEFFVKYRGQVGVDAEDTINELSEALAKRTPIGYGTIEAIFIVGRREEQGEDDLNSLWELIHDLGIGDWLDFSTGGQAGDIVPPEMADKYREEWGIEEDEAPQAILDIILSIAPENSFLGFCNKAKDAGGSTDILMVSQNGPTRYLKDVDFPISKVFVETRYCQGKPSIRMEYSGKDIPDNAKVLKEMLIWAKIFPNDVDTK